MNLNSVKLWLILHFDVFLSLSITTFQQLIPVKLMCSVLVLLTLVIEQSQGPRLHCSIVQQPLLRLILLHVNPSLLIL